MLTADDRLAIHELIGLHGHLMDEGRMDELHLLFIPSIRYDVTDFGRGVLEGIEAFRDAALAVGDGNPLGHHTTNIVVEEDPDGLVRARSKGIGIRADGTAGSVVYEDSVVRTDAGWRIAARMVRARRRALRP